VATLRKYFSIRFLLILLFPVMLSGCAEFRAMISILFNGANSLSTSAFEFDELRSGTHTTCAVLGDKTVRCVGGGTDGSLGTYDAGPAEVVGEIKQVASGKEFTCMVVGANQQAFCFGRNDVGQLGNPSFANSVKAIPVLDAENSNRALIDVKTITVGDAHACALVKSGRVICWGDNSFGQTGSPDPQVTLPHSVLESERNPKPIQGIHEVAAGANSTCLVARDDSTVLCFGERFGYTRKVNWMPEEVEKANAIGALSGIKQIGVGRGFGCGLAKNSEVFCWGRNDFNQLGALSNLIGIPKATAVQVTYPEEGPMTHIEDISVGERHACAINRDEKTVFCWGDNRYGQLGNTSVRGNPEQVALGSNNLTLKGVKSLGVGPDRTCIVSVRDELFCWGNGAHGLLGNDRVLSQYPARVLDATGESFGNAGMISLGFDHSCVIDLSHKLYCFGINNFGQLGFRAFSGNAILADKKPISKVSSMDTYGNKTCVVHGDDQGVACFGAREIDNINKIPEHNSFIAEEVKRGAQPLKGEMGVSIGKNHLCVIESTQGVSCVNQNDASTPTFTAVLDSTQHPLKDIWQIRTRDDFNCALTQENGGIWCWGDWKNDKWPVARLIPTQGKNTAEYIQFSMSSDQICGIRGVERFVYCTHYGETSADHFELEPLSTADGKPIKGVLMIAGGEHHLCAADEDGKLFCWGQNDFDQLGYRSKAEYQKPIRVTFKEVGLKKITRITAGDHYTCVAGSDTPSLFCFGESLLGGGNSPEPLEYPL
jgi:alpha-tubulin suppressor-like RCC1 family protein